MWSTFIDQSQFIKECKVFFPAECFCKYNVLHLKKKITKNSLIGEFHSLVKNLFYNSLTPQLRLVVEVYTFFLTLVFLSEVLDVCSWFLFLHLYECQHLLQFLIMGAAVWWRRKLVLCASTNEI